MARQPVAFGGIVVLVLAAAGFVALSCGTDEGPESGGPTGPSAEGPEGVQPPTDPFGNPPDLMAGGLVQKLEDAGEFERFIHAMTKAEALHELQGQGPVTVFAPSDEAFQDLPEATAEALNANLRHYRRVLQYHMVPGRVAAADLADRDQLETLAGVTLPVTQTDGGPAVGGAPLVMKDIEATNGLVHSIGKVLLPPGE